MSISQIKEVRRQMNKQNSTSVTKTDWSKIPHKNMTSLSRTEIIEQVKALAAEDYNSTINRKSSMMINCSRCLTSIHHTRHLTEKSCMKKHKS